MPLTFRDDVDNAVDHADGGLVVDGVRRTVEAGRPSWRWPGCSRAAARGRGAGRSRSQPGRALGRRPQMASIRRTPCRSAASSPCSRHSCRSTPCRRARAVGRSTRTRASSGRGRGRRRPTRAAHRSCARGEPIAPRRCWAERSARSTPPTSTPVRPWAVQNAPLRTPTPARRDRHEDGRTSPSGCTAQCSPRWAGRACRAARRGWSRS